MSHTCTRAARSRTLNETPAFGATCAPPCMATYLVRGTVRVRVRVRVRVVVRVRVRIRVSYTHRLCGSGEAACLG